MRLENTSQICVYLDNLLTEYDAGKVPNTNARIRTNIVRTMIETKKVEIVNFHLGPALVAPVRMLARSK